MQSRQAASPQLAELLASRHIFRRLTACRLYASCALGCRGAVLAAVGAANWRKRVTWQVQADTIQAGAAATPAVPALA